MSSETRKASWLSIVSVNCNMQRPESPSSESFSQDEQTQALLTGNEYGEDDIELEELPPKKPTAINKSTGGPNWNAIAPVLLIFALVAGFFAARWIGYTVSSPLNRTASFRHYVLDPKWDFNASPTTREYWWTVENTELNPDGVYKSMVVINGRFPGPIIRANQDDTIVVHISNKGVNATSIHWHGIYQNGSNWMDGTVGVTQCPIAPWASFTYRFHLRGQSGTYWYHAHQGTQVADGLYGPLVVHSRRERQLQKLEYATDRVVMVQDYYHDLSSALLFNYLKPDRENAEPVPDGALINGRNIRNCDALPHRRCSNATAGLTTFKLTPDQNHRLRFINTGSFAEFQIQIDEHEFAVTEVDGTDVEPVYYHRLNINSGQRYSIVLSTNITTTNSFWMRARMVTDCFAEKNPDLEAEVRAIVQYESKAENRMAQLPQATIPTSRDWPEVIEQVCKDMNTTELVPVSVMAAPPKADTLFYLWGNFQIGDWRLSRGFFNGSSWRSNVRSPSLERFIYGYAAKIPSFTNSMTGINAGAFDMSHEMVIQIDGIQTIDILVQNFDDGNHAMHLHGYHYFVLAQGHGYFPWDIYDSINITNPLRRDTASVQAYSWLLIRLVANNPGMWAFHCEISWHTEAGMLMQFLTRPNVVGNWTLPTANVGLCKAEGLEKGTTPGDDIWYGNTG